jgi:hypothetical protein
MPALEIVRPEVAIIVAPIGRAALGLEVEELVEAPIASEDVPIRAIIIAIGIIGRPTIAGPIHVRAGRKSQHGGGREQSRGERFHDSCP